MTKPKPKRHKWNLNINMEMEPFPSTYQIDQCKNCGLLKLHKNGGAFFFKEYLIHGVYFPVLPECFNKT